MGENRARRTPPGNTPERGDGLQVNAADDWRSAIWDFRCVQLGISQPLIGVLTTINCRLHLIYDISHARNFAGDAYGCGAHFLPTGPLGPPSTTG
jgi:hypothetical protein